MNFFVNTLNTTVVEQMMQFKCLLEKCTHLILCNLWLTLFLLKKQEYLWHVCPIVCKVILFITPYNVFMITLMVLRPYSTQGVNELQGGQSEIVHTLTTCERIPCYLVCSWPPPLTPVTCKHIVTNTAHILVQVTIYRRLRIGRDAISTKPKPTIYRNLYTRIRAHVCKLEWPKIWNLTSQTS